MPFGLSDVSEDMNDQTGKGKVSELETMLPEYYELRGWTDDGVIPKQLRDRLGI